MELLVLALLVSPVAVVMAKAFVASKDYYDYNKKKLRYISRVTK